MKRDTAAVLAGIVVLLGLFGVFGLEKMGVSPATMNIFYGAFLTLSAIGIFYRGVIVALRQGKNKWIFDAQSTNFSFREKKPGAFWSWTIFYALLSLLLVCVTLNLFLHHRK